MRQRLFRFVAMLAPIAVFVSCGRDDGPPDRGKEAMEPKAAANAVAIEPGRVLVERDLSRLLGGNLGLWYEPEQLKQVVESGRMDRWRPGLLRMPGGSWSDELYWNGNGVRTNDILSEGATFDASKRDGAGWRIDYSGYAPQFHIVAGGELSDFHGHIDVRAAHEFIRDRGAETMVTVNAGTGTPEMAAEWVRWANVTNDFHVRYWEIGNELEGDWELGHFLPGGGKMSAEVYVDRYREFAKAMKAVDPSIAVGGPAAANEEAVFAKELIQRGGDLVDFISFHTYPTGSDATAPEAVLAGADSVLETVARIRGQIARHRPDRADKIEIGVTEWHVQVHEDRKTANLLSGLWCAKFVGRMLEAGVDFANIWDLFSTIEEGGHGLFDRDDGMTPRAAYWALTLWSQEMGGTLVKCSVPAESGVTAFATKDGDGNLAVMLINGKEFDPVRLPFTVGGKPAAGEAEAVELSHANYLWNDFTRHAEWSLPPVRKTVAFENGGYFTLPPFSATVVHLSGKAAAGADAVPAGSAIPGILAPASHPANLPLSVWVTLRDEKSGQPFTGKAETAFEVSGPIRLRGKAPLIAGAARRVELTPQGPGKAEIVFRAGSREIRESIDLVNLREREQVVWPFDAGSDLSKLKSSHHLTLNQEVRRNESVAAIDFGGRKPDEKAQTNRVLEFGALPGELDRASVGGVRLSMKASDDLACADPKARLQIVLQSNGN
ncbi:MAG: hypothetical protein KDM91_00545, partial [Verrucomicrobiae bacterium]|nr:hypothetical protein [Verrucomicrobiae bacterium]